MLRPCIEKKTGNIVLLNVETADLSRFEVIYDEKEGNRGAVDSTTGQIVQQPSAFSERSAEITKEMNNAKIDEAIAKNPTAAKTVQEPKKRGGRKAK